MEEIATSLEGHVRDRAKVFASEYREHLEDPIETDGKPSAILDSLLAAVRRTPYKVPPRSYVVVSVGLERLLGEEVPASSSSDRPVAPR